MVQQKITVTLSQIQTHNLLCNCLPVVFKNFCSMAFSKDKQSMQNLVRKIVERLASKQCDKQVVKLTLK